MPNVTTKERPILFSGPMVRAILEGRKTQTRRVIKPQPLAEDAEWSWAFGRKGHSGPGWYYFDQHYPDEGSDFRLCPYGQLGDRLWVRETFLIIPKAGDEGEGLVFYRATDTDSLSSEEKWRPSIFMPRLASRVTLEITGVRVQRLQEISEGDALAEGVGGKAPEDTFDSARDEYAALWNKLNAKRGYGWDTNPWVWAVEFVRVAE